MTARIRYAHLSSGLRGCYVPDTSTIVSFRTRRELRAIVEDEAAGWREAGAAGASRKAVSAMVQAYWARATSRNPGYLDTCLPLRPEGASTYSSGIFLSPSTRADYRAAAEVDA